MTTQEGWYHFKTADERGRANVIAYGTLTEARRYASRLNRPTPPRQRSLRHAPYKPHIMTTAAIDDVYHIAQYPNLSELLNQ